MVKLLYRFKGCYNVLRGTDNSFCDITYFPHKCATFVVPLYFGIQKCWRWQFYSKSLRSMAKFAYRLNGLYNVFCGTEIIFCYITYFPHKCTTFVVPFVFWYTKMLTLTILTQNRWGVWLKFYTDLKVIIMCFVEQKIFSVILRIFLTNAPPLWFPFVFWYTKMLTLTIFTQNRWGVWLKFYTDLKVIIMCFVEQKIFSVILRIFLTNAPPLWFPLYFGIQKCWRWQFLTQNRWGVWLKFLYRFIGLYNVFCGTEIIFCYITYFPHKCTTFVVPFVFWYTKMLTLTIFTQNPWGVWLNFLYRFKGCYNVLRGTDNIFCDNTYFPHKCATFVVPFVFWYTKMLTLTIFTPNRWGVWLKFVYRLNGLYNVFCGTEIIFCYITYFPHKCTTFVVPFVFWYTKCWRWQFWLKIVEEYG